MNLLAADIVERFYTFLWPMMRIGAMLMAAPLFSLDAVTVRIRVAIAMVLTFFIYPLITWPIIDPVSAEGLLEIVNQLFIGALMGLMLQVAVGAIVVAGQSIAGSMGLSMASMMDPYRVTGYRITGLQVIT
jgi:flagellar biosynthetic protein FliR